MVDVLDIALLLEIQRSILYQVAHADNGVHGGADFVAHVGQKLAFGSVSHLGASGRLFQGGDIPVGADHLRGFTESGTLHNRHSANVMGASVRPEHSKLSVKVLFPS